MPGLLPDVDPDGLLEFSVVFTDRSLNHMSKEFQGRGGTFIWYRPGTYRDGGPCDE